jgi:hypothetical protein
MESDKAAHLMYQFENHFAAEGTALQCRKARPD